MPSIIENLNSVITTKNELNSILRENGVNPGEVFSDYPTYFRDVIGSGGSDKVTYSYLEERLSDYPTYSYSNGNYVSYAYLNEQEYATESYVVEYVAEHGGGDMSAYVTKTELSACGYLTSVPSEYITQAELSANSYLTEHQSLAGYATESYVADYVATYAPTPDLSTYVTKSELSAQSYITSNDLPVINENIVPKENNTYTLGDANNFYNVAYTTGLFLYPSNGWVNVSNWQTKFRIGNSDKFYLTSNRFYPNISGDAHLGSSGNSWGDTYTNNLYTNTAYLQDTSYSSSIVPKETKTYTLGDADHLYNAAYTTSIKAEGTGLTIRLGSNNRYFMGDATFRPITNNYNNLGTSNYNWATTYTSNLYANTSYITDMWLSDTNKFSNRGNSQINLMLNNAWRYVFHVNNFSPADDNARDLGQSSTRWRSTYTTNLYADNIHNFIWTGTAAEYAALPDYTTYQIYLIQE